MKILISTTGSNTLVELADGLPDLSAYSEPTKSILQSAFDDGDFVELEESSITSAPNWEALTSHILGGALYGIYARLTSAQFVSYDPDLSPEENGAIIANANNIAVAAGKLDQAVAVTRIESAVAASFQLLITTSNYRFTQEEKDLWNPLVASLNFSALVYLP